MRKQKQITKMSEDESQFFDPEGRRGKESSSQPEVSSRLEATATWSDVANKDWSKSDLDDSQIDDIEKARIELLMLMGEPDPKKTGGEHKPSASLVQQINERYDKLSARTWYFANKVTKAGALTEQEREEWDRLHKAENQAFSIQTMINVFRAAYDNRQVDFPTRQDKFLAMLDAVKNLFRPGREKETKIATVISGVPMMLKLRPKARPDKKGWRRDNLLYGMEVFDKAGRVVDLMGLLPDDWRIRISMIGDSNQAAPENNEIAWTIDPSDDDCLFILLHEIGHAKVYASDPDRYLPGYSAMPGVCLVDRVAKSFSEPQIKKMIFNERAAWANATWMVRELRKKGVDLMPNRSWEEVREEAYGSLSKYNQMTSTDSFTRSRFKS